MSAKKFDILVCFGYSYKRNTYAIDGSDAALVSIAPERRRCVGSDSFLLKNRVEFSGHAGFWNPLSRLKGIEIKDAILAASDVRSDLESAFSFEGN